MGINELLEAIGDSDRARAETMLGANPSLVGATVDGVTPLELACAVVTSDRAIPAVDAGADAHAVVDALLEHGADPSAPGHDGLTPLHHAGFCGNDELAGQLLAAGADVSATVGGVPGATPLSFALFYANPITGASLAAAVRAPDDLRSAAGLDDVAAVERLLGPGGTLAAGADAGIAFTAPIEAFPPRQGPITAQLTIDESLTWASRNDARRAAAALVERGADVNANPYRGTALLWATYSDRAEMAQWLIDQGADVNLRHDFGSSTHGTSATALHLAGQYSCWRCIDVLMAAGADPTITDGAFDDTPVGWAEHAGSTDAAARIRQLS